MSKVLLAFGANFGDPLHQLGVAIQAVAQQIRVGRISSVYRSAPMYLQGQADFLNLVCRAETNRSPAELLRETQGVEHALGRVRTVPNGPRTIDIDILAYGDLVLDTPELALPHPRMTERAFVLVPLAEIAPEWRHPVLGKTARDLLAETGPLERIRRWGPPPRIP